VAAYVVECLGEWDGGAFVKSKKSNHWNVCGVRSLLVIRSFHSKSGIGVQQLGTLQQQLNN